jgi:hypothetical protein
LFYAVGVTLESEWAALEVGEDERGHRLVIFDDLTFGEAGLGVEDFG